MLQLIRDNNGIFRSELPSLVKEGWPRHQANGPLPSRGADGVVRPRERTNRKEYVHNESWLGEFITE
jgi:hypothetical protein